MMKQITETYTVKFGFHKSERLTITARNYNEHQISLGSNPACLTVSEISLLGDELQRIAIEIGKDKDFHKD